MCAVGMDHIIFLDQHMDEIRNEAEKLFKENKISAAAKLFGSDIEDIDYIGLADELEAGTKDLNSLSINRIIL